MIVVIRLLLLSIFAAFQLLPANAAPDPRVALVIGNGAYKNTVDLPNAPNDARAVSAALKRLGFLVVEGIDLTQTGMTDKLKEFSRLLSNSEVGLVFYAGHGMQVGGENYLVPIDAVLKREADLEFEAVKVDVILRQLSRESKVKIVILDACRDNPLVAELARSMSGRSRSMATASGMGAIDTQGATGTMVAFATSPGTVALDGKGQHSPFTEALLAHMETPGIDIDVMMKRVRGQVTRSTNERQQPWTNSSLTAEVFLNGASPANGQPVAMAALTQGESQPRSTAPAAFDPLQLELALWSAADQSKSVADYKSYVAQYPNGKFADIARNRIASLSGAGGQETRSLGTAALNTDDNKGGQSDENAEDQLGLDDSNWRQIQRRLTDLGHSTKGIDGSAGPGTRAAIKLWQSSKSLAASGFLNRPLYEALMGEKLPVATATPEAKSESKSESTSRSARRSRSSDDERPTPRRSAGSNSGDSDGSARKAGEFLGGVVRGATGLKLPF